MAIRTRFAPSPTGYLHIGGLRTAAYAYALAKNQNGQFLLRIEDTDQKRQVEGAAEKIYAVLKKFGLNWDEGPLVGGPHQPYIQSQRVASGIYQQAADKLLADGHAFQCFCKAQTKEEIKAAQKSKNIQFRDPCRQLTPQQIQAKLDQGEKAAIRLKVPNHQTVFYVDLVLNKKNSWSTDFVDDAMLLKSDGFPTYHLAMPVDDHAMQITHVIRDVTWMSSTPIHLLVFQYLGYELPQIGHPTAILDPEGGKLSKRKGNVSVESYLEAGYLPEALLNFVILLGWAPKDNQEMFTLDEFVKKFDAKGFQKSNPRLNPTKLNWFNGQYIRRTPDAELLSLLKPHLDYQASDDLLLKIIPLAKDRISNLKEFSTLTRFFFSTPTFPDEYAQLKKLLPAALPVLQKTNWTKVDLEAELVKVVEAAKFHKGDFFMALRLAVCGSRVTPPLTESMLILGREEVVRRIQTAT